MGKMRLERERHCQLKKKKAASCTACIAGKLEAEAVVKLKNRDLGKLEIKIVWGVPNCNPAQLLAVSELHRQTTKQESAVSPWDKQLGLGSPGPGCWPSQEGACHMGWSD